MSDVLQLRDEHFRLMAMVCRLRALIGRAEPPRPLHLLALRHELSTTLIAHLQAEDWQVYPLLLDSPDPHISATARSFSEEMGGLADRYRAHCKQWNAQAIAADWPGYCDDSHELLEALTIRITRENRELYPLLGMRARAA